MNTIAIRAENLGKEYRIGRAQTRHDTLREAIAEAARGLRPGRSREDDDSRIWALRDVSFDVRPGEVIGVIGRNGAGKSTLLKILSRITEPTRGRAVINGRVGSLLEVGTGFHPELTGRENIFLNGAILGMRRAEIARKFDEIVAFAEIDKFLDTPVKRYSSGMYVRLAFAVAAHLEPEILLVDEVLAVGDAAFQNKCLGKMGAVARAGRTVLFVSHNMAAVEALCSRAVLISAGQVVAAGDTPGIVELYLRRAVTEDVQTPFQAGSMIRSFDSRNAAGQTTNTFRVGEPIRLVITVDTYGEEIKTPVLGVGFNTGFGQRVFTVGTYFVKDQLPSICGRATVVCEIPEPVLAPGTYDLKVALGRGFAENIESVENGARIHVLPSDFFGNGQLPNPQQGVVVARSTWKVAG